MNVIIIFNGLGNQMCQYAFYLQKKQNERNTHILNFCKDDEHNGFELFNLFGIKPQNNLKYKIIYLVFRILLTDKFPLVFKPINFFLRLFGIQLIKDIFNYDFNPNYLNKTNGIKFYMGGWHHPSYFGDVKSEILQIFKFPEATDNDKFSLIKNQIVNSNSVSIHIRRGDFYNEDNIHMFGGICEIPYYEKAISFIKSKLEDPIFFVFSNDFLWVEENIKINNSVFVDCNTGENSWRDLYLMTLCKHNIIANSSFSWWGAWLNSNKDKIVVCPDRFKVDDIHSDIYLQEWNRIKN